MHLRHTIGLLAAAGAAVAVVALVGCAPDTSAPTLQARSGANSAAAARIAQLPTPVAEATPALEPFTDQACLDCHTSQTELVDLAIEDAPTEALSSGPG